MQQKLHALTTSPPRFLVKNVSRCVCIRRRQRLSMQKALDSFGVQVPGTPKAAAPHQDSSASTSIDLMFVDKRHKDLARDFSAIGKVDGSAALTTLQFYDSVLRTINEAGNIALIVVCHSVPTALFFLDAAKRLGQIVGLVKKGSSADEPTSDWISNNFKDVFPTPCGGNECSHRTNVHEKLSSRDILDSPCCAKEFVERACRLASDKPLVVVDIGGYFSQHLELLASQGCKLIVEDTENGHQAYEMARNGHPSDAILPAIVSMARSEIKASEDFNVGRAIVDATDDLLRRHKYTHLADGLRILVIGFGKIGQSVARVAAAKTHTAVLVCESHAVRRLLAQAQSFEVVDLEAGLRQADVVFSCTGMSALKPMHVEFMKSSVYLASCTSRDKEFSDLNSILTKERQVLNDPTSIPGRAAVDTMSPELQPIGFVSTFLVHSKLLHMLMGGDAVNFVQRAVHGHFIHGVLASLLVAAGERVEYTGSSVMAFSQQLQNDIAKLLMTHKSDKYAMIRNDCDLLIQRQWFTSATDRDSKRFLRELRAGQLDYVTLIGVPGSGRATRALQYMEQHAAEYRWMWYFDCQTFETTKASISEFNAAVSSCPSLQLPTVSGLPSLLKAVAGCPDNCLVVLGKCNPKVLDDIKRLADNYKYFPTRIMKHYIVIPLSDSSVQLSKRLSIEPCEAGMTAAIKSVPDRFYSNLHKKYSAEISLESLLRRGWAYKSIRCASACVGAFGWDSWPSSPDDLFYRIIHAHAGDEPSQLVLMFLALTGAPVSRSLLQSFFFALTGNNVSFVLKSLSDIFYVEKSVGDCWGLSTYPTPILWNECSETKLVEGLAVKTQSVLISCTTNASAAFDNATIGSLIDLLCCKLVPLTPQTVPSKFEECMDVLLASWRRNIEQGYMLKLLRRRSIVMGCQILAHSERRVKTLGSDANRLLIVAELDTSILKTLGILESHHPYVVAETLDLLIGLTKSVSAKQPLGLKELVADDFRSIAQYFDGFSPCDSATLSYKLALLCKQLGKLLKLQDSGAMFSKYASDICESSLSQRVFLTRHDPLVVARLLSLKATVAKQLAEHLPDADSGKQELLREALACITDSVDVRNTLSLGGILDARINLANILRDLGEWQKCFELHDQLLSTVPTWEEKHTEIVHNFGRAKATCSSSPLSDREAGFEQMFDALTKLDRLNNNEFLRDLYYIAVTLDLVRKSKSPQIREKAQRAIDAFQASGMS